ncbi:hypothetical protein AB1L88_13085 [Tautonia sp. JC769]|uniref:hypothetical protein n=1 Tax=Tautonia sp. JC769 TaxID=3232135 RepID=UPI0034583E60
MAQTYTGEVRGGVVVLDEGVPPPPEGTKVQIQPIEPDEALRDLSQALAEFAGKAQRLPPDMAEQHDHYLHGTPKR